MASSNTNVRLRRVENLSDFVLNSSVAMLLLVCLCFQSLLAAPVVEDTTQNIDGLLQTLAQCGPPSPTFYTFKIRVTPHSPQQTKFDAACRVPLQESSNVKHLLCQKFVDQVKRQCLQEPDIHTKYENINHEWFAYEREVDTKPADLCIGVGQVLGQTLSQEYCDTICGDLEFRGLCKASAFIANILPLVNLAADVADDHVTNAAGGPKDEDNVNDGTATGDQQGDQPPEDAGNNLGNGDMETPEMGNGETNQNAIITADNGENNGGDIGGDNGNAVVEPVDVGGGDVNPDPAEPNQPDTTHLQPEGANPLEGGIQPKEGLVPAVAGGPQFTPLTGQGPVADGVAANIPTANRNNPVFNPPMAPNAPLAPYNPTGGNTPGAGDNFPGGTNPGVGGVNNPGVGGNYPGVGGVNNPAAGGNYPGAGGPYNAAPGGIYKSPTGTYNPAGGNNPGVGGNNGGVNNPGAGVNFPGVNPGAGGNFPGVNPGAGGNFPGVNPGAGGNFPGVNPRAEGNFPGVNPGAGGNFPGVNPGAGGNFPGVNPEAGGNYPGAGGINNPGAGVNYPGVGGVNNPAVPYNAAAGGIYKPPTGTYNPAGGNYPGVGGSYPGVGGVNNPGAGNNFPGAGGPYNTARGGNSPGVGVINPAGMYPGVEAGGNNTPLGGETNPPGADPPQLPQEENGEPPQGDEVVQEQGDTAYNNGAAYENEAVNAAEGGEVAEESQAQGGQENGKESQAGVEPQDQYRYYSEGAKKDDEEEEEGSDYSSQNKKGNEQYQGQPNQGYQYQGQDQGNQYQGQPEQQDQGVKYGSQYDQVGNDESESSDYQSAEWTKQIQKIKTGLKSDYAREDENDNEESESSDYESAEWTNNQDAKSADYSIFEKGQKANVKEEEQKYLDNHDLEVQQTLMGNPPGPGEHAVYHDTYEKQQSDDTKYQIAEESSSSHFLAYSLTAIILIMATYLLYHNKQKIIAIIIEGKSTSGRRRRGDGYNKLNQNVTEVMPTLQQSSKDYTF